MNPEKIKKIKEMAKRGTQYEREVAKSILEREAKRNPGLKLEYLNQGEEETGKTFISFPFKSSFERTIIFQTYFSIFPNDKTARYIKGTKKIEIEIDEQYQTLMIEKVSRLIIDYRNQIKLFNAAFIQKNQLFGNHSDDEIKGDEYSDEQVNSILDLMRGINKTAISRVLKDVFK